MGPILYNVAVAARAACSRDNSQGGGTGNKAVK